MAANKYHIYALRDTPEYKRGMQQLRDWHIRCAIERKRKELEARRRK